MKKLVFATLLACAGIAHGAKLKWEAQKDIPEVEPQPQPKRFLDRPPVSRGAESWCCESLLRRCQSRWISTQPVPRRWRAQWWRGARRTTLSEF